MEKKPLKHIETEAPKKTVTEAPKKPLVKKVNKIAKPRTEQNKQPQYLVASKEIYQVWYEAYQQILNSNNKKLISLVKKNKKIYKDWGIENTPFNQWWEQKSTLFADTSKIEINKKFNKNKNIINLSIPVNKTMDTLIEQFRNVMKPLLNDFKNKNVDLKHKYSPTINKGLKLNNIKLLLDLNKNIFNQKINNKQELAYKIATNLSQPSYKEMAPKSLLEFKELYENMQKSNLLIKAIVNNTNIKEINNVKRYVNRYKQKIDKLLHNVAEGKFPGKY